MLPPVVLPPQGQRAQTGDPQPVLLLWQKKRRTAKDGWERLATSRAPPKRCPRASQEWAGPAWTDTDPWWQGEGCRERRFFPDGSASKRTASESERGYPVTLSRTRNLV